MARKAPLPRGPQLELAGDLGLAFINTASARPSNRQQRVTSYGELLAWGQTAGVVSTLEAERLSQRAAESPAEAEATYARAAKLRLCLARLVRAFVMGKELPEADLGAVSEALAAAMPAVRLVRGEDGAAWGWAGAEDALDRMLWPVLLAGAELLVCREDRPRVAQCAGRKCTLYFVDRTGGKRRWCEKACSHRESSLRYYYRTGKEKRERRRL